MKNKDILYKRIYVIGPVGSGKTTFSKNLSKDLNIKYFELDKIVWDDENGNIRRKNEDIELMFNKIINLDSWIIEDVGRDIFYKGIEKADIIYYIDLNRIILYYRVFRRWILQKLNLELYNYKPSFKSLIMMFKWVNKGRRNRKKKLNEIGKLNSNLVIIKKTYN